MGLKSLPGGIDDFVPFFSLRGASQFFFPFMVVPPEEVSEPPDSLVFLSGERPLRHSSFAVGTQDVFCFGCPCSCFFSCSSILRAGFRFLGRAMWFQVQTSGATGRFFFRCESRGRPRLPFRRDSMVFPFFSALARYRAPPPRRGRFLFPPCTSLVPFFAFPFRCPPPAVSFVTETNPVLRIPLV